MSLLSLTDLLHAFSRNNKTIGQHPVVCFVGEQYPLLFFSWLLPRMSPEDQQFISLELGQHSHAEIRAQLETSFLGQQSVYWVRNIGDESAQELRSWIGYLQEYTGPNTVLFLSLRLHCHPNILCIPLLFLRQLMGNYLNCYSKLLPRCLSIMRTPLQKKCLRAIALFH